MKPLPPGEANSVRNDNQGTVVHRKLSCEVEVRRRLVAVALWGELRSLLRLLTGLLGLRDRVIEKVETGGIFTKRNVIKICHN